MDKNFKPVIASTVEKSTKERQEVVNELTRFSIENGNPFTFINIGRDFDYDNEKINVKLKVLDGLDKHDKESIKEGLRTFKKFDAGSIFTDKYNVRHRDLNNLKADTRFNWEQKNLDKLSSELKKCYRSNKLNLASMIGPTLSFLDMIENIIENTEIKKEFEEIISTKYDIDDSSSPTILEKLKEDHGYVFNISKDEDKVELVNKFSKIVKNVIFLLEEKNDYN